MNLRRHVARNAHNHVVWQAIEVQLPVLPAMQKRYRDGAGNDHTRNE